jgi:hypothetical protein
MRNAGTVVGLYTSFRCNVLLPPTFVYTNARGGNEKRPNLDELLSIDGHEHLDELLSIDGHEHHYDHDSSQFRVNFNGMVTLHPGIRVIPAYFAVPF